MLLKVAVLLVPASALPVIPAKIAAFVASNTTSRSYTAFTTPSLGDLHARYTGLPDSCEVLVAVSHSSVNPADRSTTGPYPQVMGSDIAGTVLALQKNCSRLKVGDKVWADIGAVVHYGKRKSSTKGKENGGYAPVAVALESQLGRMPANLGFEEAASLPKVALTSYKALAWYGGAPYSAGNGTILVLGGSGGCGTTGIQLAKALGASKIITTTSAANFDYVVRLGANEVIDYKAADWWVALPDASVNVIYDTVGQQGTADLAMPKLAPGGYFVSIVGQKPSAVPAGRHAATFINSDTNLDNLDLLETLRGHVEADRLRMPLRTVYDLASVPAAFNASSEGHVRGKISIKIPPLVEPCESCQTWI